MAQEFAEDQAGPTVPDTYTAKGREQTSHTQSDEEEDDSDHGSHATEDEDTEQLHGDDVEADTDLNSSVEDVTPHCKPKP